jgi:hypothetical protein
MYVIKKDGRYFRYSGIWVTDIRKAFFFETEAEAKLHIDNVILCKTDLDVLEVDVNVKVYHYVICYNKFLYLCHDNRWDGRIGVANNYTKEEAEKVIKSFLVDFAKDLTVVRAD